MRSGWGQVKKGVPYAVEWPEYHVECAEADCSERAMLTPTGHAYSRQAAENSVRERGFEDGGEGWLKKYGRWWCPAHLEGAAK